MGYPNSKPWANLSTKLSLLFQTFFLFYCICSFWRGIVVVWPLICLAADAYACFHSVEIFFSSKCKEDFYVSPSVNPSVRPYIHLAASPSRTERFWQSQSCVHKALFYGILAVSQTFLNAIKNFGLWRPPCMVAQPQRTRNWFQRFTIWIDFKDLLSGVTNTVNSAIYGTGGTWQLSLLKKNLLNGLGATSLIKL